MKLFAYQLTLKPIILLYKIHILNQVKTVKYVLYGTILTGVSGDMIIDSEKFMSDADHLFANDCLAFLAAPYNLQYNMSCDSFQYVN